MSWNGLLEGNIPLVGLTQWREDNTLSYKQSIEGLNAIIRARGTGNFRTRQIYDTRLLEMTKNPSFQDTLISVGGKQFALTIESVSGTLLAPNVYELNLGFGRAKKTSYTVESNDIELHNRFKFLIMEDFDTDAEWDASLPSTFNSTGHDRQVQDIPWEILSGTWAADDTYGLIGTSDPPTSLECQATGYIYAGFEIWDNYEFSVRFRTETSSDLVGVIFRDSINNDNYYKLYWTSTTNLRLEKSVLGSTETLGDITTTITEDIWNTIKIVCQGQRIIGFLNEVRIFDIVDEDLPSGRIGLYSSAADVYFDDLRVILLPPENFGLPVNVSVIDQYVGGIYESAHGNQYKVIDNKDNIEVIFTQADKNCILYLPMDEGTGTPRDHSRYNNTITLTGGSWVKDFHGRDVLNFNGSSDFMTLTMEGDAHTLYTIDLMFRVNEFPSSGYPNYPSIMEFNGYEPFFPITSSETVLFAHSGLSPQSTHSIDAHVWYRLTYVVDSVNDYGYCFLNGELVGFSTASGKDALGDTTVYIGKTSGGYFFNGDIKDIRVFNTTRWDIPYDIDGTPSTVFVFDNNKDNSDYDYPNDENCVLLLHMDEGEGTTTYDASGNGHDAILTNSPTWTAASFRNESGTCLNFTVVGTSYLVVADHADFSFTDDSQDFPFTLEAWVKLEDTGGTYTIISKYNTAGTDNMEYRLYVDSSDKVIFRLEDDPNGAAIQSQTDDGIDTYEWNHIVATYDGTSSELGLNIYVNGELVDQTRSESGTYSYMVGGLADVVIGSLDSPITDYWEGDMDEIRILSEELSAGEVAARFRSEPYLHDWKQMSRVYDKGFDFEGLPVITNGLILLDFTDYNIYEYRTADIMMPTIYGFYEGGWHLLGYLSPLDYTNNVGNDLSDFTSSEWEIETLTDQYVTIRISYYGSTALPENHRLDCRLTVKGGYPGVLFEHDGRPYTQHRDAGFSFHAVKGEGIGDIYRFFYYPEDNIIDAQVTSSDQTITTEDLDDNFALLMHGNESDYPSKSKIIGMFSDFMYDDLGSGYHYLVEDNGNDLGLIYNHETRFGGVYFVPHDIDTFREADSDLSDVTTDSILNDVTTLAGYTGDGYIHLDPGDSYVYWNVGVLSKGLYLAISRVACDSTSPSHTMNIDDDNDYDGDLATKTFQVGTANTWEYQLLFFLANGTDDIYISCENAAGNNLYIDSFYCIPLTNGINNPVDLAHFPFKNTHLSRSWVIDKNSAYDFNK